MKPDINDNNMENQNPPGLGTRMTGVIGAAFGSLICCLPMFFAVTFTRGTLAVIPAVLIPFGAVFFYERFRGYRKYSFASAAVFVCAVLYTLQTYLLARAFALSRIPGWQQAAAEYGISSFAYAWGSVLTGVNLRIMAPRILIGTAACAAGFMMSSVRLKEYAGVTADEEREMLAREKELADRIVKEQKEKEKEAKKKKAMPKSILLYGNESEKVLLGGQYTVCPRALQRRYLYVLGGAGAVLFLAFAACSVLEAVKTASVKPLFYCAVGLLMAWQALKVILSVRRYIRIDGMHITCRGQNGRVTSFTMDDIASCEEKDEGRYLLKDEKGQTLAFFSTGWENGRKLLKALEAYRIPID